MSVTEQSVLISTNRKWCKIEKKKNRSNKTRTTEGVKQKDR